MSLVPFVIEHAVSNGSYTDQPNIFTEYSCISKDQLHQTFIDEIVEFMYEFCSAEYGHGIEITSYDDFCEKYYDENCRVDDVPLYIMRYFVDGEWHIWEPNTHSIDIYRNYITRSEQRQSIYKR